jgi:biopolymer transport protein ExbD
MAQQIPANLMDGIPIDSTNNELSFWIRSITNAYKGEDQKTLQDMILVKGDGEALYPIFKSVKEALKANEIFKFRIVTEGESVPVGSELYKTGKSEKK